MTWRIGASTGCCTDRSVIEVLDALHAARISGVEVGTPPGHFDPWQQAEVQALRDRLRLHDMCPVSIHAPFGGLLDLSDPNPHHRHAAIGAILTAATALKELGGQRVVVHTSDVPRDGQNVTQRLQAIRDSLRALAGACEQMDVLLTVESPLPHLIGGGADEFAWILSDLPPAVAVCLDTGHTTLGHQWRRFLEVSGRRLSHIHANDHHGRFDDHLPPGDGCLDWAALGRDLQQVDFDGWIILELQCPEHHSLADHFARARQQLTSRLP
jgi:sugar phosphate isomerase/epimerase